MTTTTISIVFDNYSYLPGFPQLWGFSCFVRTADTSLLFDTGSNGRVLLRNMRRLGLAPTDAQSLFISHPHWDHIGGLDSVLEANPNLRLFVPSSLSKHLVRDLEKQTASVTVIGETSRQINPSYYSTGVMGEVGEQALVVHTPEGLIVITGCAHPGIEHITERAVEMLDSPILLLLGGFHLMQAQQPTIAAVIEGLQSLGVRNVCPTHCSGDLAIRLFRRGFGEHWLQGGTGKVIQF